MLPLDRRHRFDGQEVAWGRMGDGPALVLIHGTPFSSQVWRRIAPLLARRWTVYYFDLLGYGLSDMRDQQDVSLSVQNRLLASLFAEWKIDRPDVLCHDFGGATALRGYFLNGLRFHSLTIFDAVAVAPWGSPFVVHVRKHEAALGASCGVWVCWGCLVACVGSGVWGGLWGWAVCGLVCSSFCLGCESDGSWGARRGGVDLLISRWVMMSLVDAAGGCERRVLPGLVHTCEF